MAIELCVEPRKVYTKRQFITETPPYGIGLDGIVKADSFIVLPGRELAWENNSTEAEEKNTYIPQGPYANFDHHAMDGRTKYRSTAAQVHLEINLGLFELFQKDGEATAIVYVNDPDQDVCRAWWGLKNHELVKDHATPLINRLFHCTDLLDATAGAYPFGDIKIVREMAWIDEPYNLARFNGLMGGMTAEEMKGIIDEVEKRITLHIVGKGEELALEGHYEILTKAAEVYVVKETGPAARAALFNDGVNAFVSVKGKRKDGNYDYSYGRKSNYVPFDIARLCTILNTVENEIITDANHHDGSDLTAGSPRETGSTLSPEAIAEIIKKEKLYGFN